MDKPKKNPAAGNGRANQITYLDSNHSNTFLQEPILWKARQQSFHNVQENPTSENIMIDCIIASLWKQAAKKEVFNA